MNRAASCPRLPGRNISCWNRAPGFPFGRKDQWVDDPQPVNFQIHARTGRPARFRRSAGRGAFRPGLRWGWKRSRSPPIKLSCATRGRTAAANEAHRQNRSAASTAIVSASMPVIRPCAPGGTLPASAVSRKHLRLPDPWRLPGPLTISRGARAAIFFALGPASRSGATSKGFIKNYRGPTPLFGARADDAIRQNLQARAAAICGSAMAKLGHPERGVLRPDASLCRQ